MLFLTMAMNIHMSTRFLQLKKSYPNKKIFEILNLTTNKMFWPILYTVLTTIIAFLSLIFSEIKPIIDFGWMMTLRINNFFYYNFYTSSNSIKFCSNKKYHLKKMKELKNYFFFSKFLLSTKKNFFNYIYNYYFKFFGIK